MSDITSTEQGERIAKVMARAGLCSRREAESWIVAGRVQVNGDLLTSPARTVTTKDKIEVDGRPLPTRERTRLWLYHKPRGLVTTNKDEQGRSTLFEKLPNDMPRVMSIGRLDITTEGLLLLTNDGGLARILELPETGWLRRYRVRIFGTIDEAALKSLEDGVTIDGVTYGPIAVSIDQQRHNRAWLTIGLREGKNREIKKVMNHLGLEVTRLIRISYGPFQLGALSPNEVSEVRSKQLRDQLGPRLITLSGADFSVPKKDEPSPKIKTKSNVKTKSHAHHRR